jgi:hypothetical protein
MKNEDGFFSSVILLQFFIFNSSFFIEFCEAKFPLGEPLRFARVGLSAPSPSRLMLRFHGVLALRAALVGSHFVASVVPLLSLSRGLRPQTKN